MKINIITVTSGWILTQIAHRTAKAINSLYHEAEVVYHPVRGANNFYVDVQNCYRGKAGGVDVGLFTHVHENNMANVPDSWLTLDHIIHMSSRSLEQFKQDKRTKPPMSTKMPGENPDYFWQPRKPTIGIFQRGQYEGKGFNFMLNFAESNVVRKFNWTFVGGGWDDVVNKIADRYPVSVKYYKDSRVTWPEGYLTEYRKIDYLLIPSKWEGGPMGMLEAALLGIPIISADVGWAGREIPVFRLFKDREGLEYILNDIVRPMEEAYEAVRHVNYYNFAEHIIEVFKSIHEQR